MPPLTGHNRPIPTTKGLFLRVPSMDSHPLSYDIVPYESKPLEQSRPAHLSVIGSLFGMQPPDFRSARVLEIGCATGVNLLPMAALHPQASFLGIDISRNQIETGQQFLTELGLSNVTLRHLSITELEEEPFDYILCHGVFSWVDATVRQAILRKTGQLLTANGIAYISYNTLPGWNMIRSLREMMQFHTQNIEDPEHKATQARLLLTFLRDNAACDAQSPYRQVLASEVDLLTGKAGKYLLHDHLAYHNTPFYFHQFYNMAKSVGLQYLGEAQLPSLFTTNFSPEAQALLNATDDIFLREQYMDFLTNRRFRMTLLCRDHIALQRNVTPNALEGFYLHSLMQPDEKATAAMDGLRVFSTPQGARIQTAHPMTLALLTAMAERRGHPFRLSELIHSVSEQGAGWSRSALSANVQEWLLSLLYNGGLVPTAEAPAYAAQPSRHPEAWSFARAQARRQEWVTNLRHEPVSLDPPTRILFNQVDGTRTQDELVLRINEPECREEMARALDGRPAADGPLPLDDLATWVAHKLDGLAREALLVR